MLYTQKLLAELERKREQLAGYQSRYGRQLAAYRDALASLSTRFPTADALLVAQERALAAQPGALSAGARTRKARRQRHDCRSGRPSLTTKRRAPGPSVCAA